jgi:hypothetical protein
MFTFAGTPPPTTLSPAEIEMQKLLSVRFSNSEVRLVYGSFGAARCPLREPL